jgi:hypothetical protein
MAGLDADATRSVVPVTPNAMKRCSVPFGWRVHQPASGACDVQKPQRLPPSVQPADSIARSPAACIGAIGTTGFWPPTTVQFAVCACVAPASAADSSAMGRHFESRKSSSVFLPLKNGDAVRHEDARRLAAPSRWGAGKDSRFGANVRQRHVFVYERHLASAVKQW